MHNASCMFLHHDRCNSLISDNAMKLLVSWSSSKEVSDGMDCGVLCLVGARGWSRMDG